MDQDRILYRGEAFTLTGNSLRQDAAHWAEVQPDGQVKTMKNGRYSEWRIFPEAGNAPHYRGNFEVLNQAYGLALHEAGALLNEEGTRFFFWIFAYDKDVVIKFVWWYNYQGL